MNSKNTEEVICTEKLENDIVIKWEKVPEFSKALPGRDGHCACSVDNILYIFGGIVPQRDQQSPNIESNELLEFNIDTKAWRLIETRGELPCPRSGATMTSVGRKLFLFGGLSRETGWLDTVHEFDIDTKTWHAVNPNGVCPSARDKLASAVIGELVYIFGGFGPQGMEVEEEQDLDEEDEDEIPVDQEGAQFGWFNDLYIYNTASKTFSSPMQMNLGCPTPRAAHGMCSVGKNLVIFGGRDAEGRQNDLHIFNTESRKWVSELVIKGYPPAPRSFHTVTAVGDRVVVFGGRGVSDQHFQDFHIFDTAKRCWLQPELQGSMPSARGVHTVNVVRDKLVLFGGSAEYSQESLQCSKYYSDFYMVNTVDVLSGSAYQSEMLQDNQENLPSKVKQLSSKERSVDILKSLQPQ